MRIFASLLAVTAVVVLAINLGNRVPPDSIAMAAGVLLGALASIPVSLALGALLGRRQPSPVPVVQDPIRQYMSQQQPYTARGDVFSPVRDYPPVVIINPAGFQNGGRSSYQAARLESLPLLSGQREFRIIGEEAA